MSEHITCPCCQTEYSEYDAASEYVRVLKFVCDQREHDMRVLAQLEYAQDKLREVMEFLRVGAPGRALEAAERNAGCDHCGTQDRAPGSRYCKYCEPTIALRTDIYLNPK